MVLALPALVACASTGAAESYRAQGLCAGFPRIAVRSPAGTCVGRVADASDGLRMPRRLLEVAPGRFWIVDMGQWEPRRGRLLELRVDGLAPGSNRLRVLASGLDRPHGLARGPDGKVYVGEAGTVWRTPVGDAVQREDVITGLPDDGAHPLKELVFGGDGRLYLNVGSFSDACRDDAQRQPRPCPETQGPRPRAAVWAAQLGGPGFTLQSLRPFATGLRNSLGLAPAGRDSLWQAENSVDYTDATVPAEELNHLREGSDHGWPYCVTNASGRSVPARGYEAGSDCERRTPPVQAWAAHRAPLQLLLTPPQPTHAWSNRLIAVWHGYRPGGHRVVAWPLDAAGRPTGARQDLLHGWEAQPGVRPMGTPAGVAIDHRGWLWVVEDRNRTVLVVAPEAAAPR
jgi:glucose/arabinose dehydrogenase